MISVVGESVIQSDDQRDAQLPASLKNFQHFAQADTRVTKYASRKTLSILLVVASIVFCVCATVLAVTYGMLYSKVMTGDSSKSKSRESTSLDTQSDARNWPFNTLNLQKSTCGMSAIKPKLSRIINGQEAVPHSWPWMVTIGLFGTKLNLLHACGGSIINKRYILTAAHCVNLRQIFDIIGKPKLNNPKYSSLERMLKVFIGVHDRETDIGPENTFSVEEIIRHPFFNPDTFENDLALIKLSRDIEFTQTANIICLDDSIRVTPGEEVLAIGWGFTEKTVNKASRVLMQVPLSIKSESSCELSYSPKLQFCAGNRFPRRDTCNGDSGSGLMKYVNNRWTLVGIVSNGDVSCDGMGVYTYVSYYYEWILNNMN